MILFVPIVKFLIAWLIIALFDKLNYKMCISIDQAQFFLDRYCRYVLI